jgi:hypothetical protein
MNTLSVWAAMLLWEAVQLTSGGSITGTIRLPGGGPAVGVRVVAMAVPNTARRAAESVVFESLAQTDSTGRYRLDNISPGRYYIAAGPVAVQTYHPGATTQSAASIVLVTRDAPLLSGVDFTLNAPLPTAAQGAYPAGVPQQCCRLQSRLFMEDKSPVPQFPIEMRVLNRGGSFQNLSLFWQLGYVPLSIPLGATADIAIEGLPPGYVLKSVAYGGKDFGLTPFVVDGKSLGTLDLILGYDLTATAKKVIARGKVINQAPELKVTSIRFASTMANGPAPVVRLQPDGSFEFSDIPVGVYRWGVLDPKGSANTSPNFVVIRDDVSGLTIDLRNNPFPEFVGIRPERTVFADGKKTALTGVITQKLTPTGAGGAYFRMNVKDAVTGVVTPWAVFAEHDWQVPKIIVGETLTVPGVPSTDGTNRFNADPF